jgi:hypothetical protein
LHAHAIFLLYKTFHDGYLSTHLDSDGRLADWKRRRRLGPIIRPGQELVLILLLLEVVGQVLATTGGRLADCSTGLNIIRSLIPNQGLWGLILLGT